MNKGAKRWFYGELMPAAWARWDVVGVSNARDWFCYGHDPYTTTFPWKFAPDSTQYKAIIGFDGHGNPIRRVLALGLQDYSVVIDTAPRTEAHSLRPPASPIRSSSRST
jgi:hypothetical protein